MKKPRLVQHCIDEHVRHAPGEISVTDAQDCLTYGELDELSNRLAHCLKAAGVTRQDCVAFCMQRSVHCLTAILGILKADAIYVPLDPRTPESRRMSILADCQPRAFICDKSTIKQIKLEELTMSGIQVVVLDPRQQSTGTDASGIVGWQQILACSQKPPEADNSADDLAYIMYTSGSTGHPKGVMISHQNIRSYVDWAVACFGLNPADRILCTAPFHFDMSTFDVHAALRSGGTLCIASDMMMLFPENLVRFMEEQKVTVWKGVSSLLMYLARAGVLKSGRMPNLKTVLFAGEPLPTRYLMQWMNTYPEKRFINAYGPTEATGVSLYYELAKVPASTLERVPIGRPCTDTEVFLLKEDMSVGGEGEIGELCIAGAGLAKGYFNDPVKTNQVFIEPKPGTGRGQRYYRTGDLVKMRHDGNYEYVSRLDNQVKIMGYRIELGEIEHAMLSIDGVDDAVVIVEEDLQSGLNELVACYESLSDLRPDTVMAELKMRIPGYMMPKKMHKVISIPRNERGKVDRKSLGDAALRMMVG
ncbi:MAG: amino acid adenylation domain-containing protein [Desulfuromonadales bacterium]|nr:amino acid adenylation domain-containing protein [Desulfuromonadales bacterium]